MTFNWRKWNKAIHRDFGYFFLGMTIIYGLSGIALNHMQDWNPNYVIINKEIQVDLTNKKLDKAEIKAILDKYDEKGNQTDRMVYYWDSETNKFV